MVTGQDAVTEGGGAVTFEAYAAHIGTSRPYVSKLVKQGIISGPALVAGPRANSRLIVVDIADRQRAEVAEPGRELAATPASESNYAREKLGLVAAQRQRTEMDNAVRRGELIERSTVAAVLLPAGRRLTDAHKQALRDAIRRGLPPHEAEQAMDAATLAFINEITADGQLSL